MSQGPPSNGAQEHKGSSPWRGWKPCAPSEGCVRASVLLLSRGPKAGRLEKDTTAAHRRHQLGPGAPPSAVSPGHLKAASGMAELQRSRCVGGLHQKGDPPSCIKTLCKELGRAGVRAGQTALPGPARATHPPPTPDPLPLPKILKARSLKVMGRTSEATRKMPAGRLLREVSSAALPRPSLLCPPLYPSLPRPPPASPALLTQGRRCPGGRKVSSQSPACSRCSQASQGKQRQDAAGQVRGRWKEAEPEASGQEEPDGREGSDKRALEAKEGEPESVQLGDLLEKEKPSVFVEVDLGDGSEEVITCAMKEEKQPQMDMGDLSEDEIETSWVCCIPYSTRKKVEESS
ncbi:uncharacterized protein C13orf46 homolog [Sagmatias obliquidens]|uniref:uncharacterized protein C13orf46 homolog n=1 Tax=Sagmatias obliquidens TaxID=3371155 RepID=UPI000F4408CA|nr:uncharacterized protein C13orf46 homolog [Lagenorhynchus obliquidens]